MRVVNDTIFDMGSATHAAKRAADMIFALQDSNEGGQEQVKAITATLVEYGERDPRVTIADIAGLRLVAAALHEVFAASDTDQAAAVLNKILKMYATAPRLSNHGEHPWHLHVDDNDHAPWHEWFATSSALALAMLLAEKQQNPAGLCASASCRRPFIDVGKGGGRTYCSPRCATRERVAAYRQKTLRRG